MEASGRKAVLYAAGVPFCLWFGYVALEAVFGSRLSGAALARQFLMTPACALLSFLAWRLGRGAETAFPPWAFLASAALAAAVEQGIKFAVAAAPPGFTPLPGGWLAFAPTLNTRGAWIASLYNLSIPMIALVGINVLSIPILLHAYRRMLRSVSRRPATHAAFVAMLAGAACSLADKLFRGGSLDYIAVRPLFVCDLKDIYLCFGISVAAVEYLRVRGFRPDPVP